MSGYSPDLYNLIQDTEILYFSRRSDISVSYNFSYIAPPTKSKDKTKLDNNQRTRFILEGFVDEITFWGLDYEQTDFCVSGEFVRGLFLASAWASYGDCLSQFNIVSLKSGKIDRAAIVRLLGDHEEFSSAAVLKSAACAVYAWQLDGEADE